MQRGGSLGSWLQPWGRSALLPRAVLDVNDESPTFFPAVYNVSLPEDVARDFKVVRLNCTDADVGLNAELSYFITGTAPQMGSLSTADFHQAGFRGDLGSFSKGSGMFSAQNSCTQRGEWVQLRGKSQLLGRGG